MCGNCCKQKVCGTIACSGSVQQSGLMAKSQESGDLSSTEALKYTALNCTIFKVRRKEQSSGGGGHNIFKEMTNSFKTSHDFSPRFFFFKNYLEVLSPLVRILSFFPCCCLLFNLSGAQACPACVGSAPTPFQVLRCLSDLLPPRVLVCFRRDENLLLLQKMEQKKHKNKPMVSQGKWEKFGQ